MLTADPYIYIYIFYINSIISFAEPKSCMDEIFCAIEGYTNRLEFAQTEK